MDSTNVSFVIPAYNEENVIARCIGSIRKQVPGATIFVVDNGCTDFTSHISTMIGATIIHQPQKGVTRARQKGLEACATKYVAFIDADVVLPSGWIDKVNKIFQDPKVVAASGPHVFENLMPISAMMVFVFYLFARLLHLAWPTINGANFVVDRAVLLKVGGFDQSIEFYGDDTHIARQMNSVGKVVFDLGMFNSSSARRFHAEGMSKVAWKYVTNYFWIWFRGKPLNQTYKDHR